MQKDTGNGQDRLKQVYCPGCDAIRMVRFKAGETEKNCTYCGEVLSESRKAREKARKKSKKSPGKDRKAGVRELQCPSCGSDLEVRREDTVTIVCDSCGSRLDPEKEEIIKERAGLEEEHPPRIPVELGTRGTYRGTELEVIGRLRYRDGKYTWDEWCLFSEEEGYWWLTEYNFHYHIYKPAKSTPNRSVTNLSWKDSVSLAGTKFKVLETGSAEVIYVEGELPWNASIGDTVNYMDAVNPPNRMAAEWTSEELNIYIGEYVQPGKLWKIFNLEGNPPEPKGVVGSQPLPGWINTWFYPSLAVALLFLIGYGLSYLLISRDTVKTYQLKLNGLTELTRSGGVYRTDPFKIENAPDIMRINMRSPDVDNSWAWVRVGVLNGEDKIIYKMSDTLEYYHGVSGGESWSEGDPDTYRLMKLQKPGTYRLAIQVERGGWRGGRPPSRLTVRVETGAFASRYLFYGFLASLILPGILIFLKSSRYQKVWGE